MAAGCRVQPVAAFAQGGSVAPPKHFYFLIVERAAGQIDRIGTGWWLGFNAP